MTKGDGELHRHLVRLSRPPVRVRLIGGPLSGQTLLITALHADLVFHFESERSFAMYLQDDVGSRDYFYQQVQSAVLTERYDRCLAVFGPGLRPMRLEREQRDHEA